MNTSSNSCKRFFLVLVSHCCDIPEGKEISVVLYGTMVHQACIQSLVTSEKFGSMEGVGKPDMEGT